MVKGRGYGKKRKIRKLTYAGDTNITNSATTLALSTITEDETLVRIVGNMFYSFSNAGTAVVQIVEQPSGTDIIPPVSGSSVRDGRDAGLMLWNDRLAFVATNDTAWRPIDVKGMRKLEKDDVIALQTISNNASVGNIHYALTLFFKKA